MIYFTYGIRNSHEGNMQVKEREARLSTAGAKTVIGSFGHGMSTMPNEKRSSQTSYEIATGANRSQS